MAVAMDEAVRPVPHGRLAQLDGLRAVAVVLVMLQHHFDFLPWGWVGVHLFFALSGFLITGILRRARGDRAFWGPFYVKRGTRILPPLVPFGSHEWPGKIVPGDGPGTIEQIPQVP